VNPWKPILAALVIFTTGVITGGLLVSYADHVSQKGRRPALREPSRPATNPGPVANNPRDPQAARPLSTPIQNRVPRVISEEFIRRLDTEMELTSGQRTRVREIIAEGQARNKESWDRIAPELRREMAETQKRIREILTPEQRAKFEELMKQSRPASRRAGEEPSQPGNRPRDQRRLPPPDGERQSDGVPPPPGNP
jgi:hypothetical protein